MGMLQGYLDEYKAAFGARSPNCGAVALSWRRSAGGRGEPSYRTRVAASSPVNI